MSRKFHKSYIFFKTNNNSNYYFDNAVNNLEWVTCQENQIHKHKTGLGNNYTRKIVQYTSDNVFIKEYKSISLASKETNISKSSISGVLRGKRKTSGGFVWKYLD